MNFSSQFKTDEKRGIELLAKSEKNTIHKIIYEDHKISRVLKNLLKLKEELNKALESRNSNKINKLLADQTLKEDLDLINRLISDDYKKLNFFLQLLNREYKSFVDEINKLNQTDLKKIILANFKSVTNENKELKQLIENDKHTLEYIKSELIPELGVPSKNFILANRKRIVDNNYEIIHKIGELIKFFKKLDSKLSHTFKRYGSMVRAKNNALNTANYALPHAS